MSLSLRLVLLLAVVLAGCTQRAGENSAQGALSNYVSRSFAVTAEADKPRLIELTTGEVKAALENLKPEAFKQYFLDKKREFMSLRIKDERKVSDDRYSITYELTYRTKSEEHENVITNKKNAIFFNEGGKWLIAEVRNLKTFIEHKNEMSF